MMMRRFLYIKYTYGAFEPIEFPGLYDDELKSVWFDAITAQRSIVHV